MTEHSKLRHIILKDCWLFNTRVFKVYNSVAKKICHTEILEEQKKILLSKIDSWKNNKYMIEITNKVKNSLANE